MKLNRLVDGVYAIVISHRDVQHEDARRQVYSMLQDVHHKKGLVVHRH